MSMHELAESPVEPKYERSLMSGRDYGQLAVKYGYRNLASLAEDIPDEAEVIDVGAGLSNFGRGICYLRPDVRWINADVQYGNFRTQGHADEFDDALASKPKNLEYVEVDALELVDTFGSQRFDRVFSYWMISYITMMNRVLGVTAAENMLRVAKPDGVVAVGPVNKLRHPVKALRQQALGLSPSTDDAEIAGQAEKIVAATAFRPHEAKNMEVRLQRVNARVLQLEH